MTSMTEPLFVAVSTRIEAVMLAKSMIHLNCTKCNALPVALSNIYYTLESKRTEAVVVKFI
jgi:hypothetical protein